jgi:malate dehydrogenase (oxaloacetate-decarboxylating)
VGRHGLLHSGMTDLQPVQMQYAQPLDRLENWARDAPKGFALKEVIEQVKPTVLIGTTGQPRMFTEEVVRAMARGVERPAIFPLSNPTSRSEATPADLIAWTDGRALVATGSPFSEVSHGGRTFRIAQCNNVYIFPGVGLGVIAARARRVSDAMFLAAARALGDASPARADRNAALFPPLEEITQISRRIALATGAQAQREGLAEPTTPAELERRVDAARWDQRYSRLRRRR